MLSSAPNAKAECRSIKVTHPFHPLFGHRFDMVNCTRCWGEKRVFYLDEADQLRCLPASWTSAVGQDPFFVISAGRAHFRVTDLLELAKLIQGLA